MYIISDINNLFIKYVKNRKMCISWCYYYLLKGLHNKRKRYAEAEAMSSKREEKKGSVS